jgi:predicted metal-binding protein
MHDRQAFEALFHENGFGEFHWIEPEDIVVAQWVRMKCVYGCSNYGRNASCPPNVPTVTECREFFCDYSTGVLFHFQKELADPEDRHRWTAKVNRDLLKVERAVFLAGYEKAFLMFMDSCSFCEECPGVRAECIKPELARPSPEAMAVDVFSTVRKVGYPIEVLSEYSQPMNRYAILLIE